MVRTVFGCGEREEAAAALCPPDYLARRYPVWRMGAGRGLATFLLASPLATLAPIQLGRTRLLDIGREIMMGVGNKVASVIMLTFPSEPCPHADFSK